MISFGQASKKLTKAEKKQELKNIDSLFIVYSLPISISLAQDFSNVELKDSIIQNLKNKKFDCPDQKKVEYLIKENMFAFLPNPATEIEKYKETMDKVAQDRNYYFKLMELADPFLQKIVLSSGKDDTGSILIVVKRQNYPNARKNREWSFKFDLTESVQNLAARIVDTLINKSQIQ